MPKANVPETSSSPRMMRPALSPEARENQLIFLATDLAEQQLRDGTASSQVITHYLKQGSMREKLERERLIEENRLLKAKTEALESQKRTEELFAEAIKAFGVYSGKSTVDDSEYDEYED